MKVHMSIDQQTESNPGLLTGCGKKLKLCGILEANCAGQKLDCAGYCAGLRNFAPNKIFGLPLLTKANIEFFFSCLFFCHNIVKFLL